jgi:hypothetical protein
VARLLADAVAACHDTDAIIYAPLGMAGYHRPALSLVPMATPSTVIVRFGAAVPRCAGSPY